MSQRLLFVLIALLWFTLPVHAQDTVIHDGIAREFWVFVPDGLRTPAPLVIALHGGGGTAAGWRAETDWDTLAQANGFIVVYPQGVNREWNEERGSGLTQRRTDTDDVGFINTLIDLIAARYPINLTRVYAMGFSNGGFMSLRLACDLSARIAGIGVIAAQFTEDMLADCAPVRPLRVAVINGTDDPIIPYDGGAVQVSGLYRGDVLPTDETLGFWLDHNACNAIHATTTVLNERPLDATSIEITQYDDCASGGAAALYRVVGGGHTMPGGSQYLPRAVIGNVSREMHLPTELWRFWSEG